MIASLFTTQRKEKRKPTLGNPTWIWAHWSYPVQEPPWWRVELMTTHNFSSSVTWRKGRKNMMSIINLDHRITNLTQCLQKSKMFVSGAIRLMYNMKWITSVLLKVCMYYLACFSCSLYLLWIKFMSSNLCYIRKPKMRTLTNTRLNIGPPLIWLWFFLEVYICSFLDWIRRSSLVLCLLH